MRIRRAVITAAARSQRTLPLQTLVDRDGRQKAVLCISVEEALSAGIDEICVVVCPGDEEAYAAAAEEHAGRLCFVPQEEPLGYGHAIACARDFIAGEPFLHMVGDHVFVNRTEQGWARQVKDAAEANACAVSAVQPTREGLLPYFGAVGGQRVPGMAGLYAVDRVIEKPSPTEAEQALMVPGLRAGHYLCFFGMHVLVPAVMDLLAQAVASGTHPVELSPVLHELAQREKYLALEVPGDRYPIDVRYGLLAAQLGLALEGRDRDQVLAMLCDLLARRQRDSER